MRLALERGSFVGGPSVRSARGERSQAIVTKRIVVLSDGTGQSVGRDDSNVLHLCRLLDLSADSRQLAIYDPGIGTHVDADRLRVELPDVRLADPNPRSSVLRRLRRPLELGFGLGTAANIRQLYRALIDVYEPDDEIFLFGFSRGAFTVRALAGVIFRCGILQRASVAQTDRALSLCQRHYTGLGSARAGYRAQVDAFRREHSRPCNVRFLGVWDTVKSVGYLRPKNLPHTRHNAIVEHVRHALSIDERRSFYLHTTWGGLCGEERPAVYAPASFDLDLTDYPPGEPQDVKEVWFAGNHSDVGGGYPERESSASTISLRWMMTEAQACGLQFDADRSGPVLGLADESVTQRHDEMRDRLSRRMLWTIAEYTPRKELQNEPPPPTTHWRCTPAGPRKIAASLRRLPDGSDVVCVHRSACSVYSGVRAPWLTDLREDQIRIVP